MVVEIRILYGGTETSDGSLYRLGLGLVLGLAKVCIEDLRITECKMGSYGDDSDFLTGAAIENNIYSTGMVFAHYHNRTRYSWFIKTNTINLSPARCEMHTGRHAPMLYYYYSIC